MNWFKMLWLTSEERDILRKAKNNTLIPQTSNLSVAPPVEERAFKKLLYSNKCLTVIFGDDSMISAPDIPVEIFDRVKNAKTREEIERFILPSKPIEPPKDQTKEEDKLVKDNLFVFRNHPDFIVVGDTVQIKGVNIAIPAVIVFSFIEVIEKIEDAKQRGDLLDNNKYFDQYIALKMFWLKLALNSLPQSREDLLVFIKHNDVRITRNGNLILYRRIVSKDNADIKLVTFVSQTYYDLKKRDIDPKEVGIYISKDDSYGTVDLNTYDGTEPTPFANMEIMYRELPKKNTNTFTAAHDNSVDIRLGAIYSIPDSGINLNNGVCAAGGLHAACVNYDYSGFGDVPVVVLVNPSKAITVPRNEIGKLRTTEMFIACVNDKRIGTHFDEDALAAFDSEYHDHSLSELEEIAKTKSFETLSIKENVPAVSLVDINAIKEMLKTKIVTV